jgi:hypothetical protein
VLFTELCQQLDSLAATAGMVAASILRDTHSSSHGAAAEGPADSAASAAAEGGSTAARISTRSKHAGERVVACLLALLGTWLRDAPQQSASAPETTACKQLVADKQTAPAPSPPAEARRQAFVQAALRRCISRLGSTSGGDGHGARVEPFAANGKSAAAADAARVVDRLISAATSVDNLSRMFEGWQAWL